jgi:hypothetical protein
MGRRVVSGAVAVDGVPVEQGHISFQPTEQSKTSAGVLIVKGHYAIVRNKGLSPGKYRVAIHAIKPAGE